MKLPKGLKIKDIKIGVGETASKGRIVLIHYDCYLPRGEKCGTSRDRPYPAQIKIGERDVFVGLEYGVYGMAVGGIRSVLVSHQLTHQERKVNPSLPLQASLRYEIELLKVSDNWDNFVTLDRSS